MGIGEVKITITIIILYLLRTTLEYSAMQKLAQGALGVTPPLGKLTKSKRRKIGQFIYLN